MVEECKAELTHARASRSTPAVKIGIMIEMPSAALIADLLAPECDFFSIGTNDLIQYTLAVDRVNEHVGYLYQPLHPAILRMLRIIADVGPRRARSRWRCAARWRASRCSRWCCSGCGLDELSMNAVSIPVVKSVIRASTVAEARQLADQALTMSTPGGDRGAGAGSHVAAVRR